MNLTERNYVQHIVKKYKTASPYDLINSMGIIFHREELGSIWGYYYRTCRIKHIVLNSQLEAGSPMDKYVLSHEIGHSIMHPDANTPFLRANTFISVDKMEIEANKFAMELLISDDMVLEYMYNQQYSIDQFSRLMGYKKELIALRLKS